MEAIKTDIARPFYAAYLPRDAAKYSERYREQLELGGKKTYQVLIKPRSDIRVAGRKTASEEFYSLYKTDADFRKASYTRIKNAGDNLYMAMLAPNVYRSAQSATVDVNKGLLNENVYKAFNAACLTDHSKEMQSQTDKFFDALRKKDIRLSKMLMIKSSVVITLPIH